MRQDNSLGVERRCQFVIRLQVLSEIALIFIFLHHPLEYQAFVGSRLLAGSSYLALLDL